MMDTSCKVPTEERVQFGLRAVPGPDSAELSPPTVLNVRRVSALVRWAFYGFVFSIFFEYPPRANLPVEIPTITGCFFLLIALLHADACFSWPPPAPLKWLVIYLGMWVTMSLFSEHPAGGKGPLPATLTCSLLLAQCALVFWVACNLMSYPEIAKSTLWTLVVASVTLRVLALFHIVHSHWFQGRLYILGQNPNTMAHHVSLGLVTLMGLATARKASARWPLILVIPCAAVLVYTIVQSGSRGGVTTAAIGVLALAFQGGSFVQQIRALLICLLAGGLLYWAVDRSPTITRRYEKTFHDTDMAGREDLFPNAWDMFVEKPLLGWGPIDSWDELGRRAPDHRRPDHPEGERDPHNVVLEVLTSTGLVGAIPISICLGLCTRAAWRARGGAWGALPFAMVVTVFVVNMSGNFLLVSKADWVVLAFAVANGELVPNRGSRGAAARRKRTLDQLAAPAASTDFRDGSKRPDISPPGVGPKPILHQQGEPT